MTKSVALITTMFRERDLMVSWYVADEDMKSMRYHNKLRDKIPIFFYHFEFAGP